MESTSAPRMDYPGAATSLTNLPAASAASWPAIIAGAFVATATTLILIGLGSGLGFASISPWPGHGASVTTFAVTTAIWLVVTQWLSSCLGGYIAGRLRTRWVGTHTHEVFFRDTAHGLVTWAVATVLVAGLFLTAALSTAGAGARALGAAGGAIAGGAAAGMSMSGPQGGEGAGGRSTAPMGQAAGGGYELDRLFRSAPAGSPASAGAGASGTGGSAPDPRNAPDPRMEAAHITANALATGSVPDEDRQYLATTVAARSGLSQADAQQRVNDYIAAIMEAQNKAKAAADTARKAAAQAAIYTALSMLIGAFIASVSAALGGRLRDEHI